jgi:hypothetical protein
MPPMRTRDEVVVTNDGKRLPLRTPDGAFDPSAIGRADAAKIAFTLVSLVHDPAREKALRTALDSVWPEIQVVPALPDGWRVGLAWMGDVPTMTDVWLLVDAPTAGKGDTVLEIPLDAYSRAKLAEGAELKGGLDALAVVVAVPYACRWTGPAHKSIFDIGRSAGYALAPWLVAADADPKEGAARLEAAVRREQTSRFDSTFVLPSWGLEHVTGPVLRSALVEVAAGEVDWGTEVAILLDPRLLWVGPPRALRTIAPTAHEAEKRIGPLFPEFARAHTILTPGQDWLLQSVTAYARDRAGRWWAALDAAGQRDLVRRAAAGLARMAKVSQRPEGRLASLRLTASGKIDTDEPRASLETGIGWHPVPLLGRPLERVRAR